MHFNKMKRWTAFALSGVMAFSMAGCGKEEEQKGKTAKEETTTEESTQKKVQEDAPDYVDGKVSLPDDFENMIYPLEALMVEAASKGYSYYSEESDGDEADSFWFSMAVLTSLMNDYVRDVTVDTDDDYLYVSEDTAVLYASVLYDAIAQGNLEFPELQDDDTYATYRDEDECYGFRAGDIGTMEGHITGCEEDGNDYILTAELRDADTHDVYGEYKITLTSNSYDGEEDNPFAYAVSEFEVLEGDTWEEAPEATTEEEEEDTEEDTEEMVESTESTEKVTATSEEDDETKANTISQSEALKLAKEYYGEDAEYAYKDMVTVGDYEYYNFSVEGEDVSSTDVLVSTNGQDVIGGIQNDDGSWSFDQ